MGQVYKLKWGLFVSVFVHLRLKFSTESLVNHSGRMLDPTHDVSDIIYCWQEDNVR